MSTEDSRISIYELNSPDEGRDPRLQRSDEQIERLKNRFDESGWLSPIVFTSDERLIVDGNTRVNALKEFEDGGKYEFLQILGEFQGYTFAVPDTGVDIGPEEAAAELNIYRENLTDADRTTYLDWLIKSRIIDSDEFHVARDVSTTELLSQLEPDRDWEFSEETKAELEELLSVMDFESPEDARNHISLYNRAPESVQELWILDEINYSHFEELTRIHERMKEGNNLSDTPARPSHEFDDLVEYSREDDYRGQDEYYTRGDLRDIVSDLEEQSSLGGDDDDDDEDNDDHEDDIEERFEKINSELGGENKRKLNNVRSRVSNEEQLASSLEDADDTEKMLNEWEEYTETTEYPPIKEREKERKEALEEFDFARSKAAGEANHLAPPVETEDFGVFFHDVQEMDDEIKDRELQLIFTSPPYFTQSDSIVERWWPEGVELTDENITEKNVDLAYQNYLDEMTEILSILHSKLREGRYMILNVSDIQAYGTNKVYDVPSDLSYIIRNELNPQYDSDSRFQYDATITWDKGKDQTNDRATAFFGGGRPLTYHPNWKCERLLVFRKGSTGTPNDEFTLDSQEFQEFSDDIWQISNATIESDHSEGFATELAMTIIQLYSYPGDTVADPFGGYGITPFAVKTLNEQKYPSDTNWKGLAWENFSSESTGDMDFRERTSQLLTGNLSLFRDEYFTA